MVDQLLNISTQLSQSPYSSTVAPFMLHYKNLKQADFLEKVGKRVAFEASVRGFAKLLDPFVSETIAFQGLVDATIREGRTTAGAGYIILKTTLVTSL